MLYRKDQPHCDDKECGPWERVGRWLVKKELVYRRETWRIEDDGWVKDVPVEPGVGFNDTEKIVLAIRHKRMVNRLSEPKPPAGVFKAGRGPSDVDAGDIVDIKEISSEPRTYEVTTGVSGATLRITITGDVVELTGYSTYEV